MLLSEQNAIKILKSLEIDKQGKVTCKLMDNNKSLIKRKCNGNYENTDCRQEAIRVVLKILEQNSEEIKDLRISKLHSDHLRECWNNIVKNVLGDNYYNYGMDSWSCDKLTAEDIINKKVKYLFGSAKLYIENAKLKKQLENSVSKDVLEYCLKDSEEKYRIYKKGIKDNPNLKSGMWRHLGEVDVLKKILGKSINVTTLDKES